MPFLVRTSDRYGSSVLTFTGLDVPAGSFVKSATVSLCAARTNNRRHINKTTRKHNNTPSKTNINVYTRTTKTTK